LCIVVHFQPVIKLLQKGVRVHQKRDFDAKNAKFTPPHSEILPTLLALGFTVKHIDAFIS